MSVPFQPQGVWTALVTPFFDDGRLNRESFQRLIEFQIAEGISGLVPAGTQGSVALAGAPAGRKMGVVRARRGHMTLLPVGAAYQFQAGQPSVILLQTLAGADTIQRWAEICQTTPRSKS